MSGLDYVVNAGSVDMLQDINRVSVEITLLQVNQMKCHTLITFTCIVIR